MRQLNLANYAKLYENARMGFVSEANPPKADVKAAAAPAATGPKNPDAVNLVINANDREELKLVKQCIRDMEPVDAFNAINQAALDLAGGKIQEDIVDARARFQKEAQEKGLKFPNDVEYVSDQFAKLMDNPTPAQKTKFSVTINGKEIKLILDKLPAQVNGKTAVKPDFDSVGAVEAGMDLSYLASKLHEAVNGAGTWEWLVSAVGGAVLSHCFQNRVPPAPIFDRLKYEYYKQYDEHFEDGVLDDFSGNARVFCKGMFGDTLTESDFSDAAWGEFATDPLLWGMAAIQVGTTIASAGLLGPEWAALDAAAMGAEGMEIAATTASTAEVATTAATGAEVATTAATGAEVAAGAATGAEVTSGAIGAGQTTALLGTGAEVAEVSAEAAPLITDMVEGADGVWYASEAEAISAGTKVATGTEAAVAGAEGATAAAESTGFMSRVGGKITMNIKKVTDTLKTSPQKVFTTFRNVGKKSTLALKQMLAKLSTPVAQQIIKGAALAEIGIDIASVMTAGSPGGANMTGQANAKAEEAAAKAVCESLYQLAKGYTSGSAELKIAATLLKLNPASWQLLNKIWQKYHGDTGQTLYQYCIASELGGDLLVLVNGYILGLGGEIPGDPDKVVSTFNEIKSNIGVVSMTPNAPVTESIKIKSFSDFLKK